jgi:hypothetical protein
MGLNEKIASSRQEVAAYRISPYIAMTASSIKGNRNWSPELVPPPVDDALHSTAPLEQRNRNVQATYSRPVPVQLSNGAAPIAGSLSNGGRR